MNLYIIGVVEIYLCIYKKTELFQKSDIQSWQTAFNQVFKSNITSYPW